MLNYAKIAADLGSPDAPDAYFRGATYQDIGVNKELTDHLFKQFDPDGTKYGGDVEKLKNDFLNQTTWTKSSIAGSAVEWARSASETTDEKQRANLTERLYDSAPNRLVAKDSTLSQRFDALRYGVGGALVGDYGGDLALNIAMTPALLAKGAVTGVSALARAATHGGVAERLAASSAGREMIGKMAAGEATDEAKAAVLKQGWRTGAWQAAKFEATTNAVLGGVGNVIEGEARENRGLESGGIIENFATGAALGGVLGGALGGLTGAFEGRGIARELVGDAPADLLGRSGVQTIPERAQAQRAASEEQARIEAERLAAQNAPPPPPPDTSGRDGMVGLGVDLRLRGADLEDDLVSMGAELRAIARNEGEASGLSRPTVNAIADTISRYSDLPARAVSLRAEADALDPPIKAEGVVVTPEQQAQAGLLRSDAGVVERLAALAEEGKAVSAIYDGNSLTHEAATYLGALDRRLIGMIEADLAAKEKKAPPAAAGAAPTAPAPKPAPTAPTGAAPAAPPAAPAAAAPAADDTPPAPPVVDPAATAAAVPEAEQLRAFVPEASAPQFDNAINMLEAAGVDLPTFIARVQQDGGVTALAQEIAPKLEQVAGVDRLPEVQATLTSLTGNITRARAARDEAGQKAAPAPAAAAAPTTPQGPAPAAGSTVEGGESARPTPAQEEATAAVDEVVEPPPVSEADALLNAKGEMEYSSIKNSISAEMAEAKTALVDMFHAASLHIDQAAATKDLAAKLEEARQGSDFLAVVLNGIDEQALAARGQDAVDALLRRIEEAAQERVSWHYINALSPLMTGPANVADMRTLLTAMPGLPPKDAARIEAHFTRYAREAMLQDLALNSNLDALRARYGNAVEELLGIKPLSAEEIAAREKVIADAEAKGQLVFSDPAFAPAAAKVDTQGIIKKASEGLDTEGAAHVGKSVRVFRKQLIAAGFAGDEATLREALTVRAMDARRESSEIAAEKQTSGSASGEEVASLRGDYMRRVDAYMDRFVLAEGSQGSMYPNPIINRFEKDPMVSGRIVVGGKAEAGGTVKTTDKDGNVTIQDGGGNAQRTFGRSGVGGPQGVIRGTDFGSGFFGRVFSSLRTAGSRRAAVREMVQAGVERNTNRTQVVVVGGVRISLPAKEAFGRYGETLAERLEANRMKGLVKATRRWIGGEIDENQYNARLAQIGKLLGPISNDEKKFARLWIETQDARETAERIAKAEAEKLLASIRDGGAEGKAELVNVLARLRKINKAGVKPPPGSKPKKVPVFKSGKDGKTYELVPEKHIEFGPVAKDGRGQLRVMGELIGTYENLPQGKGWKLRINGQQPVDVGDIEGAVKAIKKPGAGRDAIEANKDKLVKAPEAAAPPKAETPSDATEQVTVQVDAEDVAIPAEMSNTARVDEAMADLGIAKEGADRLTTEMAAKAPSDIAVPPGYQIVLRIRGSSSIDDIVVVNPNKHKRLGDAVSARLDEEWVIGTRVALKNTSGGAISWKNAPNYTLGAGGWAPLSVKRADAPAASVRAQEAAKADPNIAPEVLRAQRGPIDMKTAAKIKLEDGTTLADLYTSFNTGAIMASLPNNAADLDGMIANLRRLADEINSLAPHGILLDQVRRRTAFDSLQKSLAGASQADVDASLNLLRRLQGEGKGMPLIDRELGRDEGAFDVGTNYISVKGGGVLPSHVALSHEVAHWAYLNVLSPAERIEFLSIMRRKHYNADGSLNRASIAELTKPGFELTAGGLGVGGRDVSANEVFAWAFTQHYMDAMRGKTSGEASLWQRVADKVRQVMEFFFGRSANFDPELRAILDRVLPIEPGHTRFKYDTMLDSLTGERISTKAPEDGDRRRVYGSILAENMRKMDEHLAALDQALFSSTPAGASSLAEVVTKAATHLFIQLKDNSGKRGGDINTKLQAALRPYAKGKKGDKELRATGTPNWFGMFGKRGGGTVLGEFSGSRFESVVKKLDDAGGEIVLDIAGTEAHEQARKFSDISTMHALRLADDGMAWEEAAAQGEALARKALGLDENYVPDVDGLWGVAVAGMSEGKATITMQAVAMQVRDILADATEHFQARLDKNNFVVERNRLHAELPPKTAAASAADAAVEKEVKAAKKKSGGRKKSPKATAAPTEAAAAAVAQESGSGVNPPSSVGAVLSAITHRDPEQKSAIDRVGSRLFALLGITEPTNRDLEWMTGEALGDGVVPDAPAGESPAFELLRDVLRSVSEQLTNPKSDPFDAIRELAALVAGHRQLPGYTDLAVVGFLRSEKELEVTPRQAEAMKMMSGSWEDEVEKIAREVVVLMQDSPIPEQAAKVPGLDGSVAAGVIAPAPRLADGTLHPAMAQRYAQQRLSTLDDPARRSLLSMLGMDHLDGESAEAIAQALSRSVVTMQRGKATLAPIDARQSIPIDAHEGKPVVAELLARLSAIEGALTRGIGDQSQNLAGRDAVLESLRAELPGVSIPNDGVKLSFLPSDKVLSDTMSADDLAMASGAIINSLVSTKKGANIADELRMVAGLEEGGTPSLGWIAVAEQKLGSAAVFAAMKDAGLLAFQVGDRLTIVNRSRVMDFDQAVDFSVKESRVQDAADGASPLGETVLNLSFGDLGQKLGAVTRLGWHQRAVQSGLSAEDAKTASFGAPGLGAPRNEEAQFQLSKKLWSPVQLSDNTARIAKAGMHWLANRLRKGESDDFFVSSHSSMARWTSSVVDSLDSISGRKGGVSTWGNEIGRQLRGAWSGAVSQSDAEDRVVRAIRTGTVAALEPKEMHAANKMIASFKTMRDEMERAGIPVQDITGKNGIVNYLPQRFNTVWLANNEAEAIGRLSKWMQKADGRSPEAADAASARIIRRVLADGDDAAWLGGAVKDPVHGSALGKLYSRVLDISSEDMEKLGLADLFDNNARGLLIGYAQTAATRIEVAKRFGVRGHGLTTYLDIAQRGFDGVVDAMLTPIRAMTTVKGVVEGQEVVIDPILVAPMTRNIEEASQLAQNIIEALRGVAGLEAKKKAAVDALIAMHPDLKADDIPHLRVRAEAIVGALSDFGGRPDVAAQREIEHARAYTSRIAGEGVSHGEVERRFIPVQRAMSTFNSVTLLGLATLSSITDSAMPLVRSGDAGAYLKGLGSLVKSFAGMDKEGARAMREMGVVMETIVHQAMQDVHGGRLGHFTNAFFLANGLTPWTNAMRSMAGVVGFESLKSAQRIAQAARDAGEFESRKYLKAVRYLRQMGAQELLNAEPLGTIAESKNIEAVRNALIRFANESVFQPNRNDIPLQFQDNPFWKLMFQFKSYPLMLGRMVKRVVKEAGARDEATGVWIGDVKPLMYLLTVGAGAAAGSLALRDVVAGRNEEAGAEGGDWRSVKDRNWSRIAADLGLVEKGETALSNEELDKRLGWYIESLLQLGTLGLVGDMFYQSARQLDNGAFGRERIMSQLFGPSIGTLQSAVQMVAGGVDTDESNAGERSGARAVISRVPVIGQQRPWAEALTDWIAGEKGDTTLE
ncbi:hypothetical protein UFOVP708_60 [uncultured Caudovirales phage]|uniref:Large polyvalent protein associated domain-containing protein n=1 Tax=uncultured Caudovirales phage TaxID=2100421 RepID=A0A6J5NK03_9CAUD|nr:hypothetical protein UFOVP708_60 [uncultured Caudovirales phage]